MGMVLWVYVKGISIVWLFVNEMGQKIRGARNCA
jgi:hypothetical protein